MTNWFTKRLNEEYKCLRKYIPWVAAISIPITIYGTEVYNPRIEREAVWRAAQRDGIVVVMNKYDSNRNGELDSFERKTIRRDEKEAERLKFLEERDRLGN